MLLFAFFCFTFLFQLFQVSRFRPLYFLLMALFFLLLFLLSWEFLNLARRNRIVLLIAGLVVLVRLPFLLHAEGLIFASENAWEAMQAGDILTSRLVPAYLLETLPQHGVLKHLIVAYVWEFFGVRYLYLVLVQILFYLVFLYLLGRLLLGFCGRRTVVLLLLGQFLFIEVLFDFSLFLHAGTYLEMLVFVLLGILLFDFQWRDPKRLFAAAFFLVFACAHYPTAILLTVPLLACALLFALWNRPLRPALAALAGGMAAASVTPVYRRFLPAAPDSADWFRIELLSLERMHPANWPQLLAGLFRDAAQSLRNILGFEFNHARSIAPNFDFRRESEAFRNVLTQLHELLLYATLLVLLAAFLLFSLQLWRAAGKSWRGLPWQNPFYFFLLAVFLGRLLLLSPKPFHAPRFNLDLTLLLILSLGLVLDRTIKRFSGSKILVPVILLASFLLAWPQGYYFYKNTRFREKVYNTVLPVLQGQRVRYLAAGYTMAHSIYFLSGRSIIVSDSLGPLTIGFIRPDLNERVDSRPLERKAYLLYSEKWPVKRFIYQQTRAVRKWLLDELQKRGAVYRLIDLEYFELILPLGAAGALGPGSF